MAAPCDASPSAIARPMPREPPVIRAVFPRSRYCIVHPPSTRQKINKTGYSAEGVNVRPCPLFESARLSSGDLMHGWKNLRIVELPFGEEAEERVHEIRREGLAHFLPRFIVGLSLEAQIFAKR